MPIDMPKKILFLISVIISLSQTRKLSFYSLSHNNAIQAAGFNDYKVASKLTNIICKYLFS